VASRPLDLRDAVLVLNSGGVLVLPTDTLPGFHCRVDAAEGIGRIAAIKGRSSGKPLLILASDLTQATETLKPLSERQENLARQCWPGPFTLVFPAADHVPAQVTAGTGTLGVRIPEHPELQELIARCGCPLVSTSCNREGDAPCSTVEEALEQFGGEVDGFWVSTGPSQTSLDAPRASALVEATSWPFRLLREGPMPMPDPDSPARGRA
jgi:L-threonylcarbamoyladenylate synthase